MPHTRLPIIPLAAVLLAFLASCKPDRDAQNLTYDAFMASRYGTASTDSGVWTDSAGTRYEPCTKAEVNVQSQPHLLLAVCGEPSEASHATEGVVDLYVLRGTWDEFVVAAETTGIASGSNGNPGQVRALHLGADFHGFEVRGSFLGQGEFTESTSWFAPGRSGIRPVYEATSLDDSRETGPCLDDSLACTMESRSISIDSSNPAVKTFPVIVSDTLLKRGSTRHQSTRLEFDKKKWAYPAPKMMSENDE